MAPAELLQEMELAQSTRCERVREPVGDHEDVHQVDISWAHSRTNIVLLGSASGGWRSSSEGVWTIQVSARSAGTAAGSRPTRWR